MAVTLDFWKMLPVKIGRFPHILIIHSRSFYQLEQFFMKTRSDLIQLLLQGHRSPSQCFIGKRCLIKIFFWKSIRRITVSILILWSSVPAKWLRIFCRIILIHIIFINVRIYNIYNLTGKLKWFFVKYRKNDIHLMLSKKFTECRNCDLKSHIFRKSIHTRCDQRKRDTFTIQLCCFFQRFPVTTFQYFKFMRFSPLPYRPNGMDDILCGKIIRIRYRNLSPTDFSDLPPCPK